MYELPQLPGLAIWKDVPHLGGKCAEKEQKREREFTV